MASETFWIVLFIIVAVIICLMFARVVIKTVKGGNCHCSGSSCSGSCSGCHGNCSCCDQKKKD